MDRGHRTGSFPSYTWESASPGATASDTCKVTIFDVDITTPSSFPVYVCINDNLSLGSTVYPSGTNSAGTFSWTKASGPGTVTFTSSTSEDPTFSANQAGTYTAKVEFTIDNSPGSCTQSPMTVSDTSGNIVIPSCTGCEECFDGVCEDEDDNCSHSDCEICNEGVCEDKCPALGKHCWSGTCVECLDLLDCEICEECIGHECVHPCDDCDDWPQYCVDNCVCKSCSLGDAALSPCSESLEENYECPLCTIQTTNPCSNYSMREYAGETIIYLSCTGDDCETIEELCYTEYDCTTGDVEPFHICSTGDMGPPAPKSCLINLDFPVWCWPCEKDSTDEGTPSNVDSYECPS